MPIFAEAHLAKWWAGRSEEQRAQLKKAAEKSRLESDTVDLLFNTSCPYGPIGGKWETQADWDWSWPPDVRRFINEQ